MLTAAVRDLHYWYPDRFATDVQTAFPALWENNPHLTALDAHRRTDFESIECTYPLINRCNETPYHCVHGFIEFLNGRLGLCIKPTAFKGDIHLSAQEKRWYSQVREVSGAEIPFWIIGAGGKYDVTIKWWESSRFQKVVDHFRGRIQFVQVGQRGHHHPKLDGVIDLRGRTNLRELIRLVHHSQGVLCPVTGLMHLAAAVETKPGAPARRPCVVIAGGREPAHWEAYPDHQFIHTNGALRCCEKGGCWKDRVVPLRDGDPRDRPGSLCVDVIHGLPRCMDMITPDEVIQRIERYFVAGAFEYLSERQKTFACRGVAATAVNSFDLQPLHLSSAGTACDRFIANIPPYPGDFLGRGIVICGGGVKYFTNAWTSINLLRHLGCRLPVELWHLGTRELDEGMRALLEPLGVACVDALKIRRGFPARILRGWELKAYALKHSRFREVLLLDADNMPVESPEFLFETPEYGETGAIFWPDFPGVRTKDPTPIWRSCGLRRPNEPEFETGQIVLDKQRCWRALCLAMWFNENSDFYYRHIHGDKETFHLAWRKLRQPYSLVPRRLRLIGGVICQHDFGGRRIFQHRSRNKWSLFLHNKRVRGLRFEKECRNYILRLQRLWDGGMDSIAKRAAAPWPRRRIKSRSLKVQAFILPLGNKRAEHWRANLGQTDWRKSVEVIAGNPGGGIDPRHHQTECFQLGLKLGVKCKADYLLLIKGDSEFNQHIWHNLSDWKPLTAGLVSLASLYNPCNPPTRDLACDVAGHCRVVDPCSISESQAWLISRETARYFLRQWNNTGTTLQSKLRTLAARLRKPIFYHAPSLVQPTLPGNKLRKGLTGAEDFDPNWTA